MGISEKILLMMAVMMVAKVQRSDAYYGGSSMEKEFNNFRNELREEMNELSGKVEEISEEVKKMSKFSSKVEKALYTATGKKFEVPEDYNQDPITIEKLKRIPLADGEVQYVVRYTKNIDNVECKATVLYDGLQPNITIIVGSVEEASVVINESFVEDKRFRNWPKGVSFSFCETGLTSCLTLRLGNPYTLRIGLANQRTYPDKEADKIFVMSADEPLTPTLKVNPPRELVYEEGEDVKVKVTVTGKNYTVGSEWFRNIYIRQQFYDLDRREFVPRFSSGYEHFVTNKEEKKVTNGKELTATLKTSEKRVSGFLEISVSTYDSNALLKDLQVYRLLQLKPFSQSGPFPKNAVGFFNDSHEYYKTCRVETGICVSRCPTAGGNIFGLMVQKVLPDGTMVPVQKADIQESRYLIPAFFTYAPPPLDRLDEPLKFMCTAVGFDGSKATEEIDIKLVVDTKIMENSAVGQLTTYQSHNILKLECTARGKPLPNITFSVFFSDDFQYYEPNETSILLNGLQVTATKEVVWETGLPDGEQERIFRRANCMARSGSYDPRTGYDSQYMSIDGAEDSNLNTTYDDYGGPYYSYLYDY